MVLKKCIDKGNSLYLLEKSENNLKQQELCKILSSYGYSIINIKNSNNFFAQKGLKG